MPSAISAIKNSRIAEQTALSEPADQTPEPTLHQILGVRLEVLVADPYPLYRRLRAEAPLYHDERSGSWVVTGYAEVTAMLRDPRFIAERPLFPDPEIAALQPILERWMALQDPPEHTRLRQSFNKFFTPRRVADLGPRIAEITRELLDKVQAAGSVELIQDLAFPLPVSVIALLLGVPRERHADLKRWSAALAFLSEPPGVATFEHLIQTREAAVEFADYLRLLVEEKRRAPGDDVLSVLLLGEDQGERLSVDDLIANAILLLFAGHETAVNLIGNGVLSLLRHPDQLALLRENPGLIRSAVEELLRFESPIQTTTREVAEDLTWSGHEIRRGEVVLLVLGAANRDPLQFPAPDRLDITRTDNRHLAFGAGIHFCIGASLSRLEGQLAIPALLGRMPELRLADRRMEWHPWESWRSLTKLPLAFQA